LRNASNSFWHITIPTKSRALRLPDGIIVGATAGPICWTNMGIVRRCAHPNCNSADVALDVAWAICAQLQSTRHQNLRKHYRDLASFHSIPLMPYRITRKSDRDRIALTVACRFLRNSSIQRGSKMITTTQLKPSKTPVSLLAPMTKVAHVITNCRACDSFLLELVTKNNHGP